MDKKFKNLSAQYKNYLDDVNNFLKTFDYNKNSEFKDINNLYNMINDLNDKHLIVEKDIDHMFKNYEKSNEIIYKLRKLLKMRNKEIIRRLLLSDVYKNYITKLSTEYKKSSKIIEPIIINLIKKYSMTWKCCWSFVEIDENGNIKKMELFDLNDINYLKEMLKK